MLSLKACPRCRGDLYAAGDRYGDYRECIQCGYMIDLDTVPLVEVKVKTNQEAA